MQTHLGAGLASEHPDQLVDSDLQACFLAYFSDNPLSWRLIWFNKAAWETPTAAIGSLHQENLTMFIEDRGIGSNFRRNVSELTEKTLSYFLFWNCQEFSVALRSEVQKALVALSIKIIVYVEQTISRDCLNSI